MTDNASYSQLTDDELLAAYDTNRARLAQYRDAVQRLEMEIIQRAKGRGATGIPHPVFECKVKAKNEYDPLKLNELREMLSPTELEKCYQPEQEKTVVEKER